MLIVRRLPGLVWALVAGTVLFSALVAQAGEPPADPLLRIETGGQHTANINRIGVDASGRWVLTASADKTARLWDARTGRLERVFRPPIGPGNEGKLYAAAFAPGGEWIAVAGWTGWDWLGRSQIYIFDRSSGRLLRRLGDLPSVGNELAVSTDGAWLAVGMNSNTGLRIWRTSDWQAVFSDTEYGNDLYGLDFSPDNRWLAVGSFDGDVRLYRRDGSRWKRVSRRGVEAGKQPFAVRFSPDGGRLAVGLNDGPRVSVLDAETLAQLYDPDVTAVSGGTLSSLAWADGRLVAGGQYQHGSDFPLRLWARSGRGAATETTVAGSTIMDLRGLPQGGLAYGSYDPVWGVLDAQGQVSVRVDSPLADMRETQRNFSLSADATRISFGYVWGGSAPARFDVASLQLLTGLSQDEANAGLNPPRQDSVGRIALSDWKNSYTAKFNGRPLALQNLEWSTSLAIQADGAGFVHGSNFSLRRFDADAREVWRLALPGIAWAVNLSGDGRIVVASFADGTIRWFRYRDGQELLALFFHGDRKRWVAWTPSGYYAASPGGDDLIGWHVNRGLDSAADFYPASRFRERFYRPDIVQAVLETLDEATALRRANAESGRKAMNVDVKSVLPPVVEIVGPEDGSTVSQDKVIVRYRVRTPDDAPASNVRVRLNGQAQGGQRGLKLVARDEDVREVEVQLPRGESTIQLFAENRNGVSAPATLRLSLAGPAKAAPEGFVIKPKLYVLAVGVSNYDAPELRLKYAAKDARDFAAAVQSQQGKLYREVVVKVLTDGEASKDEVLDGLEWLQKEVTQKDVGMVFLAGHGVNDSNGIYYYLPANANTDRLKRTGVVFSDIKNTLASLPGKAIFFVDTCHSGNVLGSRRGGADMTAVVNELASAENGVVVFSSSTGKQYSLEDPRWNNGAFTKALVEGLKGGADYQQTGRITHKMLDLYITERVKALTDGQQSPVTLTPDGVPDFPVAVIR